MSLSVWTERDWDDLTAVGQHDLDAAVGRRVAGGGESHCQMANVVTDHPGGEVCLDPAKPRQVAAVEEPRRDVRRGVAYLRLVQF